MRRLTQITLILMMVICLVACSGANESQDVSGSEDRQDTDNSVAAHSEEAKATDEDSEMRAIRMKINDEIVDVSWEDNESVKALGDLVSGAPLTINTSMYGGFEQVGSIGASLPRADAQMTTGPGDIVLYSGNQIVVFYGSNSWAYTKLGRIENKREDELTELLSGADRTVRLVVE